MKAVTKTHLQEIERRYDPEHDIPEGPSVSWAEWYLLQAVQELAEKVEKLEGSQMAEPTGKYGRVQNAIDTAVSEIHELPEDERMNWVSYFLEALEEEEGVETLDAARRLIFDRLTNERW